MPNYAEIVKGITEMLKKGNEVKWSPDSRQSFSRIKRGFTEAPILVSPDYLMPFYIFYFSSPHTIVVVLLHRNKEGHK